MSGRSNSDAAARVAKRHRSVVTDASRARQLSPLVATTAQVR
ncbi:hypothetical protein QFZ55_001084 [Streptomyces luteogriseus]|nr:hypothetical protein [Streptomyces luteogriseus]